MRINKKSILCVWGTRPEAIKLAPVVQALRRRSEFKLIICVTAQHREMLDQALTTFRIRPDYDLHVMRSDQTPEQALRRVIAGVTRILTDESPDLMLVQGDTTTTFGASLAAFYRNVPVGHIEAGLRTHNPRHPFPEEVHRAMVDRIATLHFAHTSWAKRNLIREGISAKNIFVTGNTVVDAVRMMEHGLDTPKYKILDEIFRKGSVVLATVHRRENFGEPLRSLFRTFQAIVERYPVRLLFPVHPNPNVRKAAGILLRNERIHLVPPLSYHDLLYAIKHCRFILTDSGGLQEEAPHFHKQVLVLRAVTDRPESVQTGSAKVVGTDPENILKNVRQLLKKSSNIRLKGQKPNPFGDGRASGRIVQAISHYFGLASRPKDWKPLRRFEMS